VERYRRERADWRILMMLTHSPALPAPVEDFPWPQEPLLDDGERAGLVPGARATRSGRPRTAGRLPRLGASRRRRIGQLGRPEASHPRRTVCGARQHSLPNLGGPHATSRKRRAVGRDVQAIGVDGHACELNSAWHGEPWCCVASHYPSLSPRKDHRLGRAFGTSFG
jgi:hypothetical protein